MVEYKNPNDMKLTIKNYDKIIRDWPNITIIDVKEMDECYLFNCHYPGSGLDYWVTLSRHRMNTLPGIYAFPFIDSDGKETQGVSTDWFRDMANAVSVITQEYARVYNEYN